MKQLIISLLFSLIYLMSSAAQEKIDFSGYGAAGYRNTNRNRIIDYNQEMYFEAKLQADIRINEFIDTQIDMRGNSQDQQLELREYSVKLKYINYMDISVGHLKKPFTEEQIENSENLAQIERSNLSRELANAGYGGRSVGIRAAYKSSGKKDDLPYSYYLFLYQNNSLQQGLTTRGRYHFDDDYSAALSYFILHTGGDFPAVTNAVSPGFYIRKKNYDVDAEIVFAQNPVEIIRRKSTEEEGDVMFWGARLQGSLGFDINAYVIKKVEPLLMLSYYQPEIKYKDTHTLQLLAGSNFYFHKDVRARLNFDFLLSRTRFNDEYSLHDSRVTIEMQARF